MKLQQMIDKLRKEYGTDTSWNYTEYYNEDNKVTHIDYIFRWVQGGSGDQIMDITIEGSNADSSDWRIVSIKHTNAFMEVYKPELSK